MLKQIDVAGQRLEYRTVGPSEHRPTIVFLHEGLGCVTTWRDFPERVAEATSCRAFIYSRKGYGGSEPLHAPRNERFMHDEALDILPALLDELALERAILFGHSDGASIALIFAAAFPERVSALVVEAPHVFVEPVCVASIAAIDAEFGSSDLPARLTRHHGVNTERMFRSWTSVWLGRAFEAWSIEADLRSIQAPVLVIQGEDDEYGTRRQVDAVVEGVSGPSESLVIAKCGHAPHVSHPRLVVRATAAFLHRVVPGVSEGDAGRSTS